MRDEATICIKMDCEFCNQQYHFSREDFAAEATPTIGVGVKF